MRSSGMNKTDEIVIGIQVIWCITEVAVGRSGTSHYGGCNVVRFEEICNTFLMHA